ncbi:MAG: argininosuccinate lyase [Ardenticatenales bacterium]|nr:argininosuccinate lyase [Ardenticatenales bacterium]
MKLWGGRFARETDALVRQFNDSIGYDIRFFQEDIDGSIAWTKGLVKAEILTADEAAAIVAGLEEVRKELIEDRFTVAAGDEDIHTAVERRMTEIVGATGGKLHTGRSRNDQAATDFRLWIMRAIDEIIPVITELQAALIDHAEANLNVPMPGYTHLQHAQPVTWGHFLLSHFWPLVRDKARFVAARHTADELPLGSAALAGTGFPIDRDLLADALGFSRITQNSLDAVSNRDYVADFLYAASMLGLHLSRLSEQLILFSSQEFGFVRLDDAYSTGSSLMPQKKNPDTLELTRGKAGRLLGNMVGLLATIKGLPSSYDKDLQEDKEPVFDTFDTIMVMVPVMTGLIKTLTIRPERMAAQLEPNLLATDLADYLVKRGVPFRNAHHIVGAVVQLAESQNMAMTDFTLEDLEEISEHFGPDVTDVFNFTSSLATRTVTGGTAPAALQAQLTHARATL